MGLAQIIGIGASLYGMFKGQKEQKSDLKKAEPKSAEQMEDESRKESLKRMRSRQKNAKASETTFTSPMGVAGMKDKVGQ